MIFESIWLICYSSNKLRRVNRIVKWILLWYNTLRSLELQTWWSCSILKLKPIKSCSLLGCRLSRYIWITLVNRNASISFCGCFQWFMNTLFPSRACWKWNFSNFNRRCTFSGFSIVYFCIWYNRACLCLRLKNSSVSLLWLFGSVFFQCWLINSNVIHQFFDQSVSFQWLLVFSSCSENPFKQWYQCRFETNYCVLS